MLFMKLIAGKALDDGSKVYQTVRTGEAHTVHTSWARVAVSSSGNRLLLLCAGELPSKVRYGN